MKRTLILLLLCGAVTASAQQTLTTEEPAKATPPPAPVETIEKTDYEKVYPLKRTMSIGLFGGYAMDFHGADAMTLPEVPSCCPGYDGGTGGGFIGGLTIEFPLSASLELVTRLSYHGSNVTMTTDEPITVRDGNSTMTGTITHELKAQTTIAAIEPAVEFRVGKGLGILAGVRAGVLLGATYDEQEILDPSIPYDYQGGSGVRNASSGDISNTSSFQFGLLLGARYRLPMNADETMMFVPEVQYAPLFTSLIADQSWSVSSLRFMVSFVYALTERVKTDSPLSPTR